MTKLPHNMQISLIDHCSSQLGKTQTEAAGHVQDVHLVDCIATAKTGSKELLDSPMIYNCLACLDAQHSLPE